MGERLLAEANWIFKVKYDIYFHGGCFDGVASAAILKYFLNLHEDDFAKYAPLQHPVNKKRWKSLKMKRPSAIVDILYHPKAKIWFDHHPTTFIDKKWKKKFKKDKWHILNTKSPSCAGLILRTLSARYNARMPKHLIELAKWTDILDRINPQKINLWNLLALKIPALQIGFFLDNEDNISVARQRQLINVLSRRAITYAASMAWIKNGFLRHKKQFDASLLKMRGLIQRRGNVIFIENLGKKLIGTRFAPYYFCRRANYSVRLVKHGKYFALSVGINPWNTPKKPANIGKFLAKHFSQISAGGHSYAGSASFSAKKEALKAAPKIIDYLNKHV